nr:sugar phosphate nucleotidyltransferase [Halorubrum halophilum]
MGVRTRLDLAGVTHVFETVVDAGVDRLVVIVGYEVGRIVDRFGDAFEVVPITYVYQRERLGLGHAVLQAEQHVDGTFLLVNGDNVFAGSVEPAIEAVEEADTALAVEAVSPAVATTTGVIETDETGVTGIVEKLAQKYLDQLVEDTVLQKTDRGSQTLYCVDQLMATYREVATLQREHDREGLPTPWNRCRHGSQSGKPSTTLSRQANSLRVSPMSMPLMKSRDGGISPASGTTSLTGCRS